MRNPSPAQRGRGWGGGRDGASSAAGTRSIAALSADTPITRQAITKHLRVLEDAGLVTSTRTGRESLFTFRPDAVSEARAYLDGVSRQWDDALGRLRGFVEG